MPAQGRDSELEISSLPLPPAKTKEVISHAEQNTDVG